MKSSNYQKSISSYKEPRRVVPSGEERGETDVFAGYNSYKKKEAGLKGLKETCHEYGKLIIGKCKLFWTFFRYNI